LKKTAAFILICLALFAACDDIFEPPVFESSAFKSPGAEVPAGYGRVAINFSSAARTVFPTPAFNRYVFKFTPDGGGVTLTETKQPNESDFNFMLEAGYWHVEVKAYVNTDDTDANYAASGAEDFSVSAGPSQTPPVNIKLVGNVDGGNGTFSYYIEYPEGTEIKVFTLENILDNTIPLFELTPIAGNVNGSTRILSGTYGTEIPAGYYDLTILLENEDDGAKAGASEVVHIYKNLNSAYGTSDARKVFTSDNFSVIGTAGLAYDLISGGDNDGTYRVSKGTVTGGDVVIPAYYKGVRVTEIGSASDTLENGAFYNTGITSVTIPTSVKRIGANAFRNLTGLTGLTIPSSVTYIGTYAFANCAGLTNVTIPSDVTWIGESAFSGCNNAFTSVTIPATMTQISSDTFSGCTSLTTVIFTGNVGRILSRAFSGCTNLSNITIPDSVTDISNLAFSGCTSLASITIPENVISISDGAFGGCTNLTSVIFIGNKIATFGLTVFPQGATGAGGTNLQSAYQSASTKEGMYMRTDSSSDDWTKKSDIINVGNTDDPSTNTITWAGLATTNQISTGASGNPNYYVINITESIDDVAGISIASSFTFGNKSNINITINGNNKTITLGDSGSLLRININQTVTMNDLNLKGHTSNTATLVNVGSGTFTMNNSAISGNTAGGSGSSSNYNGGGVYSSGTFTMNNSAISNNTATNGGGVFASSGTFTMNNSTISNNTATTNGGGVNANITFTMNSSTISNNTASNGRGGGVSTSGFTMKNSRILNNTANNGSGGGVDNSNDDIVIENSVISGNIVNGGSGYNINGGGVYSNIGSITITGSTISDNAVSGNSSGGGGVYSNGGSITITDSTISNNTVSGSNSNGGGVYSNNGSITMTSSTISGNTASGGGGVYVNNRTFTMNGGAISNNTANSGGGVYSINSLITMNGGAISGNTANSSDSNSGNGGGVYLGGGINTFTMNGGAISGNTARSGGGVYLSTLGTPEAFFRIVTGTIYGSNENDTNLKNTAATNGAALYLQSSSETNKVQHGTFTDPDDIDTWVSAGNLIASGNYTNNTIIVNNGVKAP